VRRPPLPMLLPLAAIAFIVVWGGGLGVTFIFLSKTDLENWGAVIIGVALVIGVPLLGGLLTMPRR
jgi:hypothetical protein